jgi:hypothetical protein
LRDSESPAVLLHPVTVRRQSSETDWLDCFCRRRIAVGNVTSHCRRKTEVLACLRFDAVRTGWPVPLHFDFFASFVLSSDGRVGVALRNMAKTGNEQPGLREVQRYGGPMYRVVRHGQMMV